MKRKTRAHSGAEGEIMQHLRRRASRYFDLPPGLRVEVDLITHDARPIAHLYHFAVRFGKEERRILVKVPRGSSTPGPGEGPEVGDAKPRRAKWAGAEERFLLEHKALSTIDAHFAALEDSRFGTVRMFDLLPVHRAVVMEHVADPPLRDLLLRTGVLRRPVSSLSPAFHNVGAWLREYHAIPVEEHVTPRHTGRGDLIDFVGRLSGYLGESLRDENFFRGLRDSIAELAAAVLPLSPPTGRGHGDFAPRNILVGPNHRITVLDTLGRFRTPVLEDIGYFLVSLKAGWPQALGRGLALPPATTTTWEKAFLRGYFGADVPVAAVRIYEVQAMLDRWAAVVARSGRASGRRSRFARSARSAMLSRFFRGEISRRLSDVRQAVSPAGRAAEWGASDSPPPAARPRVAYTMSRFPKLTETFVLYEILALEAAGTRVEIYPLLRHRSSVTQPEAEEWIGRAHYRPFLSPAILRAHLYFIRRDSGAYLAVLRDVLRGTWGSPNFFFGAIGIFPKVVRFAYDMERRGITRVHAHFATHPALAAFVIRRLTGIPYSFTAHGSDLHVDRRMLDAKIAESDFAVTVSEFNKEVMVASCGEWAREKIHVVHCGVDTDLFAPGGRNDRGTPLRILCVASFEEVKGHRFLLDACFLLAARGIPFRCELVGDGPLRREVQRRVAALGLEGRVILVGPRPRPDVVRMLKEADVVALASHPTAKGKREGIPVALMEAMSCGTPVVSTAISGIPELVTSGASGFLVPSGDPVALADALERLARDPELRRRMGAAGRERVLRDFDLESNARRLLELLDSSSSTSDSSPSQEQRPEVETSSPAPS